MKKYCFKYLPLLALFAVIGLFATSCSKETDESEPQQPEINLDEQVENIEFEVFADTLFTISNCAS